MSQFSFTRNLSPAATCCHLQFCGRTWLSGRTCAPELVASWRRPCRDGADGGRWPRDSTLHSSALSIHQHPVYSNIIQYQRGLSQFKRELYIELYVLSILVLSICVNYMNIHLMMNQVCKVMKLDSSRSLKVPTHGCNGCHGCHGQKSPMEFDRAEGSPVLNIAHIS